jgi:hypothetical protein
MERRRRANDVSNRLTLRPSASLELAYRKGRRLREPAAVSFYRHVPVRRSVAAEHASDDAAYDARPYAGAAILAVIAISVVTISVIAAIPIIAATAVVTATAVVSATAIISATVAASEATAAVTNATAVGRAGAMRSATMSATMSYSSRTWRAKAHDREAESERTDGSDRCLSKRRKHSHLQFNCSSFNLEPRLANDCGRLAVAETMCNDSQQTVRVSPHDAVRSRLSAGAIRSDRVDGAETGRLKQPLGFQSASQICDGFTHRTIGRRSFQQKTACVEPYVIVPVLRRQRSDYCSRVVQSHNLAAVLEDDRNAEETGPGHGRVSIGAAVKSILRPSAHVRRPPVRHPWRSELPKKLGDFRGRNLSPRQRYRLGGTETVKARTD